MKKLDLGQTITILANLGVIAGIVFLAIELQQNNELLEAEARSTRLGLRLDDYLAPVNDQDLAAAILKRRAGEELSDYDSFLLGRYAVFVFLGIQNTVLEAQRGLIELDSFPVEAWRSQFQGTRSLEAAYWPPLRDFWEASGDTAFSPEFSQWWEENVVNER